jgi:hypothetical protein
VPRRLPNLQHQPASTPTSSSPRRARRAAHSPSPPALRGPVAVAGAAQRVARVPARHGIGGLSVA